MILKNVSLKPYSSYCIGGAARYFCNARGLSDLARVVAFARQKKLSVVVLGGGTNILFDDKGCKDVVVRPEIVFIHCVPSLEGSSVVTVGAGTGVNTLLDFCVERGLSGLEWAGGLPGMMGGAVRGNAGAFKGEIKDSLIDVVSLDISGEKPFLIKRTGVECQFAYRDSIFKKRDEIIVSASFLLWPGNSEKIRAAVQEKISWRISRQPLDYPNVGSIFKNVAFEKLPLALQARADIKKHLKTDPFPVIPAAYFIDKAGLKGVSCGGALVSQKHPNFIVNALGAEAKQIKQLIALVKHRVQEEFGVELEEEIACV